MTISNVNEHLRLYQSTKINETTVLSETNNFSLEQLTFQIIVCLESEIHCCTTSSLLTYIFNCQEMFENQRGNKKQ